MSDIRHTNGFDPAPVIAALERLNDARLPLRRKWLRRAAVTLVSDAQVEAPVRTGALKEAHLAQWPSDNEAEIGVNIVYAAAVHARHPTKAGWFIVTVTRRIADVFARAATAALDEEMSGRGMSREPGSGGRP